jgi:DNA-binding NtrC family response regulator
LQDGASNVTPTDPPPSAEIQHKPATILIVDDDPTVRRALRRTLKAAESKWNIVDTRDGNEALVIVRNWPVDVVVTDLSMPLMQGVTLLRELKQFHSEIVRIVHSSQLETLSTEEGKCLAHNVLLKPAQPRDVVAMVRWALNLRGTPVKGTECA